MVESTGHHPWWVVRGEGLGGRPQPEHVPINPDGYDGGGRWVDAIDLRAGDVLLLRSGEQAAITGLVVRHARLPVYNFHVEELHCYAVGHAQILVHNNSVEELLKPGGRLVGTEGSSSSIRLLPGGKNAAEDFFLNLAKSGKDVTPKGFSGMVVELPNGSGIVKYRPTSTSGPPTIDVAIPGIGIREIKFLK